MNKGLFLTAASWAIVCMGMCQTGIAAPPGATSGYRSGLLESAADPGACVSVDPAPVYRTQKKGRESGHGPAGQFNPCS